MRIASCLVVCRRSPSNASMEVLLVKRSSRGTFGNLTVFPGGADVLTLGVQERSDLFPTLTNLECLKITAIRETFEECGLLILSQTKRSTSIPNSVHRWRENIHKDSNQFKNLISSEKLIPGINRLVYYSNWITPITYSKISRFNTHFFLTAISEFDNLENLSPDKSGEILSLEWIEPSKAIEKYLKKEINLLPPQYCMLKELSGIQFDQASKLNYFVEPIMPEPLAADGDSAKILVLPGDFQHSSSNLKSENIGNEKMSINRLKIIGGEVELMQNGWRRAINKL